MKVDNSTIPPVSNVTQGDSRKPVEGATTPNTTQNTVSNDNSVRISQEAANLQSSKETNTVVDVERVQQVKQEINDGTFQVNAEVVADRLLESSSELNLTRK